VFEVWADGSVKESNPGIGGVGVIVNLDGKPFETFGKFIGENKTNNEMEYMAVIEAIKFLRDKNVGKKDCIIYTDSQLVYGQVVAGWKVNYEHLRILRDKICNLLEMTPFNIEIKWVKRWNNRIANDLAQAITEEEKRARRGVDG